MLRVYKGRGETEWGKLVAEVKAEVTAKGLNIPDFSMKNIADPTTGKVKHMWLTFWLVRPEGVEQYAGYKAEIQQGEPPSLESLLTKIEHVN